jgi:DNA-binding CsgD family transcriptional regulator
MQPLASRLLEFGHALQSVVTFEELVIATRDELLRSLGFAHAWIFFADTSEPDEFRLIDFAGAIRGLVWEVAPRVPRKGDRMIEEIMNSPEPVVIVDARIDPRTNKLMVEKLGNRTILNARLRVLDKPFGALGTGTFGDEGCRRPSADEVAHFVGIAREVSVAAARIGFLEALAALECAHQAIGIGIVRIDRALDVVNTFGAAAHFLAQPDCPLVVRDGKLDARRSSDVPELQAAVARAFARSSASIQFPAWSKGSVRVAPASNSRLEEPSVSVIFCPRVVEDAKECSPLVQALPRALQRAALLMARGLADKEMALELGVELSTARTYATRVIRALGVHGRREVMLLLNSALDHPTPLGS